MQGALKKFESEIAGKYDYLCGIARGGIVPATMLSYKTDIPLIMCTVQTRAGNYGLNVVDCDQLRSVLSAGFRVLLVEDIIDSGTTIDIIREAVDQDVDCAALIYNVAQPYKPAYHHIEIDRNVDKSWVNFFWDGSY